VHNSEATSGIIPLEIESVKWGFSCPWRAWEYQAIPAVEAGAGDAGGPLLLFCQKNEKCP